MKKNEHKKDRLKPLNRSNIAANFPHASKTETPIGVFWDIENCQVPKGKSAVALVHTIRQRFFVGHKEAEFMCVCDISKENKEVIQELNLAQVTVVHVNAISKNAADDKLKQCMRRFVDIHGSPSTVVLISADVNFATDLSDFRHRHKVRIILLHSEFAPDPLTACAHEHYVFSEIVSSLPYRSPAKAQLSSRSCELLVTDFPPNRDIRSIQHRLKQLSDNCGGRVLSVIGNTAVLRFPNADAAQRACKRMDKEDVFGHKISVLFSPHYTDPIREASPHLRSSGGHSTYSNNSDSSRETSPICQDILQHSSTRYFEPVQSAAFQQMMQPPPDLIQQDYDFSWSTNSQMRDNSCDNHYNQSSLNRSNYTVGTKPSCDFQPQFHTSSIQTTNRLSPIGSGLLNYQKSVGRLSPFLLSTQQSSTKLANKAGPFRSSSLSPFNGSNKSSGLYPSSFSNGHFQRAQSPTLISPQTVNPHFQNESENSFCDAARPTSPFGARSQSSQGIELLVTNLDQSLDINKMKNILFAAFKEHVMVLHISMLIQPDGMFKAIVKLPTLQDAQYAISQLHRRKVGHKRILISYTHGGKIAPIHIIKAEVAALLMDVPAKKMPLFKFRELFENRYHRTISISELYKLNDTVQVCDESSGRMISLAPGYRATPSPVDFNERSSQESLEKPFCERHMLLPDAQQGWAECDNVSGLPEVCISLKALAPKVHVLLDTHQGTLPLNSFCTCYEAEFGPLPVATGPDWAESQKGNVPLEHLVSCIPGVEIVKSDLGIKRVQWLENKLDVTRSISPALVNPIVLFGREMIDLLKSQIPKCMIPFNKVIPAYHHHFGRQCRVADYGFTKLIDLLDAIPHIIEILGQGQNRLLTLTHKSQIKRFASDLLRILKSLPSKQLKLSEFAEIYFQCFEKSFEVTHYGVCDVMDMISEVSENLVVLQENNDTIIGIPKREQTPEEMERTKQFSMDVIDLLRYTPSCSLSFSKFIPSYHHHFGRQCRVSFYGCGKLIELLEAIPDILEVYGSGEDKVLVLTKEEKVKVLGERVAAVVKASSNQSVTVADFPKAYCQLHGFVLHLEDYQVDSLTQLLGLVSHIVKLEDRRDDQVIVLINRTFIQEVCLRLRRILMRSATGEANLDTIKETYTNMYGSGFDVTSAVLDGGLILKDGKLKLTELYMLSRSLLSLLQSCGGHLPLQHIESEFLERFGFPCQPAQHGFSSVSALLAAFPEYFTVKGRRGRKTVFINQDIRGDFLNSSLVCPVSSNGDSLKPYQDSELLLRASPLDIFNQPIPSVVPSPELLPVPEVQVERNLMGFESPFTLSADSMTCMSEADKEREHTLALSHHSSSYYYQQLFKDENAKSGLATRSKSSSSPTFAPLPPVAWLTSRTSESRTLVSPNSCIVLNGSDNFIEREIESDSSMLSPQGKTRPRSRIAAHFALEK